MAHALRPGPLRHDDTRVDDGTTALAESGAAGPIRLAPHDEFDDELALRQLDWKHLGFQAQPFVTGVDGRRLFRVWGGTSLERGDPGSTGVFFSFARPRSRAEAEGLFAIAEFGNACRFVSEFEVPPGTVMLVGRVDPGDDVHPTLGDAGDQVFILNPAAQRLMLVGASATLDVDFGGHEVYTGPRPTRSS